MRYRVLSIVAFLLAVALLAGGLSGCSPRQAGGTPAGSQTALTADYARRYFKIDETDAGLITQFPPVRLANTNELLYVRYQMAEDDTQHYRLCRFDMNSGEGAELYHATYPDTGLLSGYALTSSGSTLFISEYFMGDMMFGGAENDRRLLKTIDAATGEVTHEQNLADLLGFAAVGEPALIAAPGERVYGLCQYAKKQTDEAGDGWVLFLYDGATGTVAAAKDYADLAAPTLLTLSDGRVALCTSDGAITPVRADSCEAETPLPEGAPNTAPRRGGDDYLFLYAANGALHGCRADSGKSESILSWSDNGVIIADEALADICLADGVVTGVVNNGDSYDVYTLTPCKGEGAPRVLVVAGYGIDATLKQVAIAFNQTYTDYTARLVNYTQYDDDTGNGDSDVYEVPAGLLRLNTELLAGKQIDVLCLDNRVSTAALIRQGALRDLYPLMDADDTVGQDAFVTGVLSAAEVEGHLYQLSTGFTLSTLLANTDLVGKIDRMDLATWESLAAAYPNTTVMPLAFARDNFMNVYIDTVFSDYIDSDRKTCHFADGAFAKYLEKSREFSTIDELYSLLLSDVELEASNAAMAQGKYLFAKEDINNFMLYHRVLSDLGEKAAFVGFPTENGAGHLLRFDNSLAILQNSLSTDAAWEFIKLSLVQSREYNGEYSLVFPTDRQAFEAQLAHYQDEASFVREDGSVATTFEGNPAVALTEEDAARLYHLIETAKPVIETDVQIRAIISAETSHYYADACTAEQAAQNIQNRVSLYLREQG